MSIVPKDLVHCVAFPLSTVSMALWCGFVHVVHTSVLEVPIATVVAEDSQLPASLKSQKAMACLPWLKPGSQCDSKIFCYFGLEISCPLYMTIINFLIV